MKFNDIVNLLEAQTEMSNIGDQTFVNNNLVDVNKIPNHAKIVNEIKEKIAAAKLWDDFKKKDVSTIDIDPSKVQRNKVYVTSDSGKLYVYDIALKKLWKASQEEINSRNKELVSQKAENLAKRTGLGNKIAASCKTKKEK
ncbi:MAG: hypothetical protein LBF97_00505 [Elusimicrobiota bacterium]|jgi:hypothetical protein|nr:hypothetical protein [Elusimicrobiota bacterium]